MGVVYLEGKVTGLTLDSAGRRVSQVAVQPSDAGAGGSAPVPAKLACGHFINAAGPWAASVAGLAGIDLAVRARRRYVFVVHCPKGPASTCPMVIDPSGVYVRREGGAGNFLCGKSPAADQDPDISEAEAAAALEFVDYDFFESEIWPVLAERIPAMEELRVLHSWAGLCMFCVWEGGGGGGVMDGRTAILNLPISPGPSRRIQSAGSECRDWRPSGG